VKSMTWTKRAEGVSKLLIIDRKTLSAVAGVTWWNFHSRLFAGTFAARKSSSFSRTLAASRAISFVKEEIFVHSKKPVERMTICMRRTQPQAALRSSLPCASMLRLSEQVAQSQAHTANFVVTFDSNCDDRTRGELSQPVAHRWQPSSAFNLRITASKSSSMSVALGPTDFNERDTTHFRWLRHTAAKSRSSASQSGRSSSQ
jgi:hypothetical protein